MLQLKTMKKYSFVIKGKRLLRAQKIPERRKTDIQLVLFFTDIDSPFKMQPLGKSMSDRRIGRPYILFLILISIPTPIKMELHFNFTLKNV